MANFSKKYYFYGAYYDTFIIFVLAKRKRAPAFRADRHFFVSSLK